MTLFHELVSRIKDSKDLTDLEKTKVLQNMKDLKKEQVNVLITGATGCGKSSTINALFGREVAKVGQSSNPETMSISRYDLNNVILFDSPGLGDGYEADLKHAKGIMDKLLELKPNGELLIDLVLVILDGSSRDLGTSYELINQVIIPNLGEDKSRLLIAINQADVAMKGRYWDNTKNQPEPELTKFLDEKVQSTKNRIYEATKVNVEPIYYAAGYKDGVDEQNPWNLSKLLAHILSHTKEEKRIVFASEINKSTEVWKSNDNLKDYQKEVKDSFISSFMANVSKGLGAAVDVVSNIAGGVVSGIASVARGVGNAVSHVVSSIGGFFGFW